MMSYQMSNVLFPGFEFGGAKGAAVVVEGAEVLEVDLEEVVALADLATGDASHPTDARFTGPRGRGSARFLALRAAADLRDPDPLGRRDSVETLGCVVVLITVVFLLVVVVICWIIEQLITI